MNIEHEAFKYALRKPIFMLTNFGLKMIHNGFVAFTCSAQLSGTIYWPLDERMNVNMSTEQ